MLMNQNVSNGFSWKPEGTVLHTYGNFTTFVFGRLIDEEEAFLAMDDHPAIEGDTPGANDEDCFEEHA